MAMDLIPVRREIRQQVRVDVSDRAKREQYILSELHRAGLKNPGELLDRIFAEDVHEYTMEGWEAYFDIDKRVFLYLFSDRSFNQEYQRLLLSYQFNPREKFQTQKNLVKISQMHSEEDAKVNRVAVDATRLLYQQTRTLEPDRIVQEQIREIKVSFEQSKADIKDTERLAVTSAKQWVPPSELEEDF